MTKFRVWFDPHRRLWMASRNHWLMGSTSVRGRPFVVHSKLDAVMNALYRRATAYQKSKELHEAGRAERRRAH